MRKAAHYARQRELGAALEIALSAVNKSTTALEHEKVKSALKEVEQLQHRELAEVEVQIALLIEKLVSIRNQHAPRIAELLTEKQKVINELFVERVSAQNEVEARFPDLHDASARNSSAKWVAPAGYMESFTAEHATGELFV